MILIEVMGGNLTDMPIGDNLIVTARFCGKCRP